MAVVLFLYLAMIVVVINLVIQIALYFKDVRERLALKVRLKRQIRPKEAGIKFASVNEKY